MDDKNWRERSRRELLKWSGALRKKWQLRELNCLILFNLIKRLRDDLIIVYNYFWGIHTNETRQNSGIASKGEYSKIVAGMDLRKNFQLLSGIMQSTQGGCGTSVLRGL